MIKQYIITYLNLALLVIFPIAWLSPLITTSLLPQWHLPKWLGGKAIFEPETLTVISGIKELWETDIWLAMLVAAFALVTPMLKCLGMALIHCKLLTVKAQSVLTALGKLAMADVFILALYILLMKNTGVGHIEADWGLYLFTGAVLMSAVLSLLTQQELSPAA